MLTRRATTVFAVCLLAAAVGWAGVEQRKDFPALARDVAKKQLAKFGKGYVARIDSARHLIYIGAQDDDHLQTTMRLLAAFSDAYRRTLPGTAPPWGVTVVLPTAEDYKRIDPPADSIGFYRHGDRTLISIDRGRVLLHEFTHALHLADAAEAKQVHPIWVREGLATLFEASEITPSGLRPRVDVRLLEVQKAIREKTVIPLTKLLSMGDAQFMADARLCYAESRYVMLYLYEKGRLDQWYRRYKASYTKDPTGLKAVEHALTSRIFNIEPEWTKWIGTLKLPRGELRSRQGRLGAELKDDPRGVKVVGLLKGGAAETAGRIKVGDIITSFNGQKISNVAEMVAAIRAAGAMQTVNIDLIRHGRKLTIQQPLGAPGDTPDKGK